MLVVDRRQEVTAKSKVSRVESAPWRMENVGWAVETRALSVTGRSWIRPVFSLWVDASVSGCFVEDVGRCVVSVVAVLCASCVMVVEAVEDLVTEEH